MEKLKISKAVIVEGKYDKIKLSSLIDGLIIPIDGFRIYKDKQKIAMIRAVALKQGIVVLTDSDKAGFQLRGFIRSIVKDVDITNIYIPQIQGKEKRKLVSGAEGILGVEGMDADILRKLFQRFGLLSENENKDEKKITRIDFYEDGIMGKTNSASKRAKLISYLKLPNYLTTNSLLDIINSLMTFEEYKRFCSED